MRRGQRKETGTADRMAGVAVVMLLVAGCEGASNPSMSAAPPEVASMSTPSPTPTPTPTADPVGVAPVPPPALTDVGADGASGDDAIAVAQYFVGLYGYVFATHDLAAWSALSGPDCAFCASVATNVGASVQGGFHVEGGAVLLDSPVVTEGLSGDLFLVEGRLIQDDSTTVDASGAVVTATAGSSGDGHCTLQYSDGSWSVLAFSTD